MHAVAPGTGRHKLHGHTQFRWTVPRRMEFNLSFNSDVCTWSRQQQVLNSFILLINHGFNASNEWTPISTVGCSLLKRVYNESCNIESKKLSHFSWKHFTSIVDTEEPNAIDSNRIWDIIGLIPRRSRIRGHESYRGKHNSRWRSLPCQQNQRTSEYVDLQYDKYKKSNSRFSVLRGQDTWKIYGNQLTVLSSRKDC